MKTKILMLVLAICSFQYVYSQAVPTPAVKNIGTAAPDLTIAKWVKGNEIKSFEKGKVYVVEFWATWCLPCIAGMPHLSEIAQKYKNEATVMGISVMERANTDRAAIEKFVAGMGDKMAYHVGIEEGRTITKSWLNAYGERGIPCAFIIDRDGQVAWIGHPRQLDQFLPLVISGKWNIQSAAVERQERRRLANLDQNIVVTTLNPYMGNPGKPLASLVKIDSIVKRNPGLKYGANMGHFTFWSLIKTDPQKALAFGREWFAANEEPRYSTVTDAVSGRTGLPNALYIFAADAYQAQLDKYPWSMDFPATYKKMADLYRQAGDTAKVDELLKKAEAAEAKTKSD